MFSGSPCLSAGLLILSVTEFGANSTCDSVEIVESIVNLFEI